MSEIGKRVSYLKGLSEGMQISDATNEGKLLLAVLDVLEDISYELEDYSRTQENFNERLCEVEDDLEYFERDTCDCDCCDDDCDCDDDCKCGCHDDLKYITVECPHCKKETSFDLSIFDKDTTSVECPSCHEKIEVIYED